MPTDANTGPMLASQLPAGSIWAALFQQGMRSAADQGNSIMSLINNQPQPQSYVEPPQSALSALATSALANAGSAISGNPLYARAAEARQEGNIAATREQMAQRQSQLFEFNKNKMLEAVHLKSQLMGQTAEAALKAGDWARASEALDKQIKSQQAIAKMETEAAERRTAMEITGRHQDVATEVAGRLKEAGITARGKYAWMGKSGLTFATMDQIGQMENTISTAMRAAGIKNQSPATRRKFLAANPDMQALDQQIQGMRQTVPTDDAGKPLFDVQGYVNHATTMGLPLDQIRQKVADAYGEDAAKNIKVVGGQLPAEGPPAPATPGVSTTGRFVGQMGRNAVTMADILGRNATLQPPSDEELKAINALRAAVDPFFAGVASGYQGK